MSARPALPVDCLDPDVGRRSQRLRTGLQAGLGLGLIGTSVGGLGGAAGLGKLWLLIIPGAVIAADLVTFSALYHRFRHGRLGLPGMGWWVVSQFNLFAVAFLFLAWAVVGGGLGAAGLMGTFVVAAVLPALRWRRQVFTAFVRPGTSRLSVVLALVPALGAGGGGAGVAVGRSLSPHPVALAVVLVISLYLLLFSQSSTIRISEPGWEPEPPPRRRRRR